MFDILVTNVNHLVVEVAILVVPINLSLISPICHHRPVGRAAPPPPLPPADGPASVNSTHPSAGRRGWGGDGVGAGEATETAGDAV